MKYVDNLELGDTIFFTGGNCIYLGFFAGYGSGTFQYYMPSQVVSVYQRCQDRNEEFTVKKLYKGYLKDDSWRIAKIHTPVFGDINEQESYERAKEILMDIKFIKS